MTRQPISVLVPCFNNEDSIEECLRRVRWADEVVVCDSFSTDRTCEVAARHADRVIQHEYRNSAAQKNWAIPLLTHPWVLIVDTDERVSPALRDEIDAVLRHPSDAAGYRIPRANHVFGRWLRHGNEWPDYQIRLFRRDRGRYEPREVHAHVLLEGPVGTLSEPLIHYPHRSFGSMRRVLLQRYTTWEASERYSRGIRFRWHQLIVRPPGAFLYRYVVRQGYRDGWQGFFMAAVWAAYVFVTYLKVRRLERGERV